jgi:glycosyltransferase involved in cell wall biosynthesis
MKVLLCVRSDYFRNFAGDSMQVIKTAEYLRKLGIEADINSGDITDYSDYDIVHLFNLTTMGETYKYYRIARLYKKAVVLSPLYWDMKKYYRHINDLESIKLWDRCSIYRLQILKGCKMVFTNSLLEAKMIEQQFDYKFRYRVIYSGVEVESEDTPLYSLKNRYSLDNYVLCVGRICRMKNQLTLARICSDLGIQLVLIGNVNDKQYFDECMKYKDILYLGFMDSYNIYNAYRFASLHALPSFVETPGMSSLEAAACGCNIVSTSEGSAEEYFKDKAIYCNPYDESSIYNAVYRGYKQSKTSDLKDMVLSTYNWENCIKVLYDSYRSILSE